MTIRLNVQVWLAAAAFVLNGCANRPTGVVDSAWQGTKVLLMPICPISASPTPPDAKQEAFVPALLLGLAPAIADKLTSFLADYLKKRGSEYSSSTTQATSAYLKDDQSGILGCLVYINGTFDAKPGIPSERVDDTRAYALTGHAKDKLPKVYAEFWLSYVDPARTALTVEPGALHFLSPLSVRTSGANSKTLAFAFQLSAPGVASAADMLDKSTGPASLLNKAPMARDPSAVAGKSKQKSAGSSAPGSKESPTTAQPVPATSTTTGDTSPKPDGISKGGDQLAGFVLAVGKVTSGTKLTGDALSGLRTPAQAMSVGKGRAVNISVTEIETENGGDLLLELGTFTSENQSTISTMIKSGIEKLSGTSPKK